MRKIIVFNNLTLDGVMQAPGRLDEDPRGGFQHGGWATPYAAMQSSEAGENLPGFSALLLGRRTYDMLYDYWPKQTGNPFTEMLTAMPKYVASTTLNEPLPWANSFLLKGDAVEAEEEGPVVDRDALAAVVLDDLDRLTDPVVDDARRIVLPAGGLR